MQKIKSFVKAHKIISVIAVLLVGWGGVTLVKSLNKVEAETRYMLATVERGTIISSVSGSGQVSASNQVDLKPKVSGDVVTVNVKQGQEVKAGQLLLQLGIRDAAKAVRDAESNLASAKLSLQKLQQPTDALTLLQTENALAQAKESKQKAEDDLIKAYEDGFNSVANAFLELPSIMTGLNDMLYGTTSVGGNPQWFVNYYADAVKDYDIRSLQYREETLAAYQAARTAYDANFADYRTLSRFSANQAIEASIHQTYETTRLIAESVKASNNLIQFYQDNLTEHSLKPNTISTTHLSSLNSYTGDTNSNLSSLLTIRRTIQTDKETITNSERSIAEKTASLEKLKAGVDLFDLQSQQLTIQQRENALLDAKEKLADYYVRAPFDGVMAAVNIKKGDAANSGTAVATLITKQRIADISFNEVDVAKIKVGQKATLTFDAIDGLTISGSVTEVDAIGTVSQGVVNYLVSIGFDTQDDRVKPGMSVSASIITEAKPDVLTVPNSAIKSFNGSSYVEMLDGESNQNNSGNQGVASLTPPRQQNVVMGISNDSVTEIVSGLSLGDQIIVRTITPTAQTTPQVTGGLFPTTGNRGFGGGTGAVRIQTR